MPSVCVCVVRIVGFNCISSFVLTSKLVDHHITPFIMRERFANLLVDYLLRFVALLFCMYAVCNWSYISTGNMRLYHLQLSTSKEGRKSE